jgi:hypothetical protein
MDMHDREILSLIVQILGLIAVVPLTFMWRRKKWAYAVGPVLGLVINIVAQILIAGQGPGACFGFVVFPFLGLILSYLTLRIAGCW